MEKVDSTAARFGHTRRRWLLPVSTRKRASLSRYRMRRIVTPIESRVTWKWDDNEEDAMVCCTMLYKVWLSSVTTSLSPGLAVTMSVTRGISRISMPPLTDDVISNNG